VSEKCNNLSVTLHSWLCEDPVQLGHGLGPCTAALNEVKKRSHSITGVGIKQTWHYPTILA